MHKTYAFSQSSFIVISAEQTTDGTVSSAAIQGGHITGSFNGTILPVGTALFAPNSTLPAGAATGNATAPKATAEEGNPILLSATYTFTIDDGKYAGDAVFVMGQTPLSVNSSIPALLMHLQPAVDGLGAKWVNKTGKLTFSSRCQTPLANQHLTLQCSASQLTSTQPCSDLMPT